MLTLDYRQHQCPYPVVETRKQMLANPEQTIQVQVADQVACDNISRLAVNQGYSVGQQTSESSFILTLTPGGGEKNAGQPATAVNGNTVIYCNSDRMGEGNEELGQVLLKNFFITLAELEQQPATIFFVNSGVKLVCHGSEALEALNALACRGVDIAACGLCLDFYHLKDQLQIGRATNMLEIAETQLKAGRVISP